MVWEVKHVLFYPKDENGMPGEPMHLIVARDVLNPDGSEILRQQCAAGHPIQKMLLVAFSRCVWNAVSRTKRERWDWISMKVGDTRV